jgi:elongation factor Ts
MSLDLIRKLREETGAGVLAAQKALQEANNDYDAAVMILRKSGQKVAAKKAERATHEGLIGHYVHATGKIGAMVAVACETDFVSRSDAFQELAHDLALHAAATRPQYVKREDIPTDVIEREREVARAELASANKPEAMWDKIIEGKLDKFASDVCFLEQKFVKDESLTIRDLIQQAIVKLGENIQVREVSVLSL